MIGRSARGATVRERSRSAGGRGPLAAASANAAAWGVPPPATVVLLVTPLALAALAVLAAGLAPSAFIRVTDEDGPIEWLQVIILLATAGFFGLAAIRLWHRGARLVPVALLIAVVGAIGVAGEEISWGQRLFGFATPAELEGINYQGEANLHNIVALDTLVKFTHIGAGLYGTVLPILALSRRAPRALRSSLLVPPVSLVSFFLVVLLHWMGRIVVDPDRAGARVSEITELAMFSGGAIFAWLLARRLRGGRDADSVPA